MTCYGRPQALCRDAGTVRPEIAATKAFLAGLNIKLREYKVVHSRHGRVQHVRWPVGRVAVEGQ